MKRPPIYVIIILAGIAIEALLSLRLWAQLTARPIEGAAMTLLFAITHALASPLTMITNQRPQETTGIVDFTVLVAVEAYLIAMLALIAICFVVKQTLSLFEGEPSRPRHPNWTWRNQPLWQPTRSRRSAMATFYVPVQPPARRPHVRRAVH